MNEDIQINEDISFNQRETIAKIERYINNNMIEEDYKGVFYSVKELQGWRFYLKAILYRDWDSIKSHRKLMNKIKTNEKN